MADPFGILMPQVTNPPGIDPRTGLPVVTPPGPPAPAPAPMGMLYRALSYYRDQAQNSWNRLANGGIGVFLPPVVRERWGNAAQVAGEFSPGAGVRDLLDASGQFTRSTLDLDPAGMLGGFSGMILGAASIPPGGRAVRRTSKEAALFKEATDAARKAGLATDEASRAQRLAEGRYTAGLWRGGTGPTSGSYFTPDKAIAAPYAAQYGDRGDLREYALRLGRQFDTRKTYTAAELRPIIDSIAKTDPKLARQVMEHVEQDWRGHMPGVFLYSLLKRNSGDPLGAFARAGYDFINAGSELVALRRAEGQVRDANKAMFNPAMKHSPNPFAAILPPALTFGALYPTTDSQARPR